MQDVCIEDIYKIIKMKCSERHKKINEIGSYMLKIEKVFIN